jgi:hypothetical protein
MISIISGNMVKMPIMGSRNQSFLLFKLVLVPLAQGGEVVHFSAKPKNEPHSPLVRAKRARKDKKLFELCPLLI